MKNEALDAMIQQAQELREQFLRVEPADLAWTDGGALSIAFDDGASGEFSPELLRAICPCAECRGLHGTPPKAFNVLSSAKVKTAALQTIIEEVQPVGNYALAITWGDGHKEGIYTWTYLRAIASQRG